MRVLPVLYIQSPWLCLCSNLYAIELVIALEINQNPTLCLLAPSALNLRIKRRDLDQTVLHSDGIPERIFRKS